MIRLALLHNRNLATLQFGTSAQLPFDDTATDSAFSPLEIEIELPCQDCGCRSIFAAVAPAGEHQNPVYLRCCQCGRERQDLKDFSSVSCGTESTAE